LGAYQDYVASHVQSSKPHCFGDPDFYDETDRECAETCAWRKECRPLVIRKNLQTTRASPKRGTNPITPIRTPIRPTLSSPLSGKRQYGTLELQEGESPWSRLVREMASTALAGAGEEFSFFFRQYRCPYTPPPQLVMRCDCGAEITLASAFCPGCGTKLQ